MHFYFKGENILTIPNLISLYRLLMFPVVLAIALLGYEKLFIILFVINLLSDVLDGFLARTFKWVTKFGAALDSLADQGTYILALLGLFLFRWTEIEPHAWLLYLFFAIFATSFFLGLARFGKVPGLHLYSAVLAGYLQGSFFFVLFVWDFFPWFYYIAVGFGVLAYLEKIMVLFMIDDIKTGTRGLYWIIKDKKKKEAK